MASFIDCELKRLVRLHLFLSCLLLAVQFFSARALSESSDKGNQHNGPQRLEIVPKLSGVSATDQNGFGIVADIRNASAAPVWLNPRLVTLTPPPELDPFGEVASWYATIVGKPTAITSEDKDSEGKPKDKFNEMVVIGPGETVPAAWSRKYDVCNTPEFLSNLSCGAKLFAHSLNFVPGDYNIKVVVNSWTTKEDAEKQSDNYQTQTSEIRVTVTATQWIIMFGAFWGAIGAYFVVPNVRKITFAEGRSYWPAGVYQDLAGLASAVLFSVIITILLARLSDTQFLVKVTVSDFWGAIAIGFLATATRKTILQKLAPASS